MPFLIITEVDVFSEAKATLLIAPPIKSTNAKYVIKYIISFFSIHVP